MKSIIGYFEVQSEDAVHHLVMICQEITTAPNGMITSGRKLFILDDMEGEELEKTGDPRLLISQSGLLFRRLGHCRLTDSLPGKQSIQKKHRRFRYQT